MRISDWSSDVCSSDLPTVDIGSGAERSVLVAVAAAAADLDHRPDGGEARLPRRRADAASQAVVVDMGRLSAIVADEEDAVVEAVGMLVGDIGVGAFHPPRQVGADEQIEDAIDAVRRDPPPLLLDRKSTRLNSS